MKTKLLCLSLLVLLGCGLLRPDNSMLATDAGYPTAEMVCNGERFNGLGVCAHRDGPVEIEIPGFYSGQIQVDSELCRINKKIHYIKNESLKFSFIPNRSCAIDILVTPRYTRRSNTPIGSFKGRIYLKLLSDDRPFIGRSLKIPQGTDHVLRFKSENKSRVVFRGCGAMFDEIIEPFDGHLEVMLSQLGHDRNDCIYEGFIQEQGARVSMNVWYYDNKFTPLSVPYLRFKSNEIVINSEISVSVIGFGNRYRFGNDASFNYRSGHQIIRLLTTAGRLAIGEWNGYGYVWKR